MKRLKLLLVALVMSIFLAPSAQAVDYGEILSAETRTGSIANPAQTDSFTFTAEAGQTVVINMSSTSHDAVDPYIFLYDPDGTIETSATCGTYCDHTEISNYQLLQSGIYTIVVRDNGGDDTGNYSLSLLLIPGPTVSPQDSDGGDILSGETKTGIIDLRADTDAYTFSGEAGQTVVINMSSTSHDAVDPYIFLYDPDGTIETSATCGTYCDHTEISNYQLLQSGIYTIVVRDNGGDNTGDYSLSFTKVPGLPFSPSVRIILNQTTFTTGEELIVQAHVVNGPNPVNVEVKVWINLPSENQMSILDPHFTFTVKPNADFTTEIFTHTFSGGEPSGDFNVGGRFLNPITGRELSVNVESFSFSP